MAALRRNAHSGGRQRSGYGSEFRYRDPIVDDSVLTVVISQSGETADTLAAQREAKRKGSPTIAVCNVIGSAVTHEAEGTVYTHAGPEISVASTKAFTSQLTALLGLELVDDPGYVSGDDYVLYLREINTNTYRTVNPDGRILQ